MVGLGVELAGALNDFARGVLADYPNLCAEDLRIILIHARDRILPELSEPLARHAQERMTARGVSFKLNTRLADACPGRVVLNPAEEIRAQTLVWTAGTAPNPLLEKLPCERDKRGAVIVDRSLVKGIDGDGGKQEQGDYGRYVAAAACGFAFGTRRQDLSPSVYFWPTRPLRLRVKGPCL